MVFCYSCLNELNQLSSAAAAAKSLQSCPTLCDPIDGSPPGSPIPRILQARTLEWIAISFSNAWKWKLKMKSLSCIRLWATPWTAAYQALLSMGFSRQEYWSGVPLPSLSYLLELYLYCFDPVIVLIYNCCLISKLPFHASSFLDKLPYSFSLIMPCF